VDLTHEKYLKLREYLSGLKSLAVAFSGGVDSTLLLKAAKDVLGDRVIAVTARSFSFPERELREAREFTRENNIEHIIVDSEELEIEGFAQNPPNRCYICKNELFTKILNVAKEKGFAFVAEASNMDDLGDYRPGLIAVAELRVLSPLREAELTKSEIRELSKELGLKTWNKQSFACLASRFPYGETITKEKLKMIDIAEQFLLDLGFYQVRVRYHGNLARIETDEEGIIKMLEKSMREMINKKLREVGFTYVAMDIKGYRTGSMNETLKLN
jgi:uncharacterized protein